MNDEQLVRLAARMGDLSEQVRTLAREVYANTKRTEELKERFNTTTPSVGEVNTLEERIEKLENFIELEVARTTKRGGADVPKPRGTFTVERLEELREANKLEERGVLDLDDSDFHETPKQRWMRENLRPGEVYAGILLGMDGKPDMHIMVQRHWSDGYSAPTLRETRLIEVNTLINNPFDSSTFVRRIPVQ